METILRIEATTFKNDKSSWCEFEGFQVITDKQTIKLGIANSQSCCESWGYFMSEDDLSGFIGARLIDVKIVDDALNVTKLKESVSSYGENYCECETMFVNFDTDKGLLQFTAYNDHNGYYGHSAVVVSESLNYDTTL